MRTDEVYQNHPGPGAVYKCVFTALDGSADMPSAAGLSSGSEYRGKFVALYDAQQSEASALFQADNTTSVTILTPDFGRRHRAGEAKVTLRDSSDAAIRRFSVDVPNVFDFFEVITSMKTKRGSAFGGEPLTFRAFGLDDRESAYFVRFLTDVVDADGVVETQRMLSTIHQPTSNTRLTITTPFWGEDHVGPRRTCGSCT